MRGGRLDVTDGANRTFGLPTLSFRRAMSVKTGSTPQRAPIGSRTSKWQTASYARPQWGVPAPPSSADGPPHPSCNHVVPTIADVGSLVM